MRTQDTLAIGNLKCNTTYTFQVVEAAGNSHSGAVLVSASTGACGAVPFNPQSYQNTVPGALVSRAATPTSLLAEPRTLARRLPRARANGAPAVGHATAR